METERRPIRSRSGFTAPAVVLLVLAALLLVLVLFGMYAEQVCFYMAGGEELTVPWGVPYEEPGVRAVLVNRFTGEVTDELPVEAEGEVDTGTMGDYVLCYSTGTLFRRCGIRRLVHVADLTPPGIMLLHDESYMPNWLEGYREEGYLAWDDADGDLTDRVEVEESGESRIYTVADAAGNRTRVVREIPYGIGRPVIRLNGDEELEISAGFSFTDPGFTCTDARGNDLSALVRCEGEVIPYAVGDYELRYRIANAAGEEIEAARHVTVRPLRNPDVVDPEGKVIYLTFDDGPGPSTDRLLDVLAYYNVKATFFVTGLYPDYADCVGRAYREGHSIGVHSMSHNYRRVYASEEAFLEDFSAVQELIREQTGEESRIFRFPGGSSNTVSRFNRGIMTRLTRMMSDMGYVYFDWNVTSGDAGETTSTEQVLQNIVDGCSAREQSIVLQHDSKDFSVAAVERVIVWGLTNGYGFAALDETSPPVHHRLAN